MNDELKGSVISSALKEQMKLKKTLDRAVCFGGLRKNFPDYSVEVLYQITNDPRINSFTSVKSDLNDVGIDLSYKDKLPNDLGFLGTNLVHAARIAQTRESKTEKLDVLNSGVVVAGICFPENPTMQSLLPLFAVKDLFEAGKVHTAYFAMPLAAYGAAGLARDSQYRQVVGIMQALFGEKLGKQVFLVPDHRTEMMEIKYLAERFGSRNISDKLASKKYPFGNLYGFIETGGYGSDITIPLLAEGKDVTIIADYRQYESIHAGIKMAEALSPHLNVQALLYTLTNPVVNNQSIREVSQDDGLIPLENKTLIAETNALFYEAALLLPENEVVSLYKEFRDGSIDLEALETKLNNLKDRLFSIPAADEETVTKLENLSIERLSPALNTLRVLSVEKIKGVRYGRR